MNAKFTGILLGAKPYSLTDERTGEKREGITLYVLPADEIKAHKEGNIIGILPYKNSLGLDILKKIKTAPAVYEVSFLMTPGADMKPNVKITDLDYVGEYHEYILSNMTDAQLDETFTKEVLDKISKKPRV